MVNPLFLKAIEVKKSHELETFPFSLPVINNMDNLNFNKKVTFFVGENGSGKSTLLEAIAIAMGFNPEGGSKNFRFSTRDSHSILSDYIRPIRGARNPKDGYFLRSESFYNLSTEIDRLSIDSYGGDSLHDLSHGEGLLTLFSNRLYGNGLYIFDEPECGLSPIGLFKLIRIIHELAEDDHSQFIISTHSPILLGYPNADIYEFTDSNITLVEYKDTEVYNLYKRCLDDDRFIAKLIED